MASLLYLVAGVVVGVAAGWLLRGRQTTAKPAETTEPAASAVTTEPVASSVAGPAASVGAASELDLAEPLDPKAEATDPKAHATEAGTAGAAEPVLGDLTTEATSTSGGASDSGTPETEPAAVDPIDTALIDDVEPIVEAEPVIEVEPVTTEPVTTEPVTTEPVTTEPAVSEPAGAQPAMAETPIVAEKSPAGEPASVGASARSIPEPRTAEEPAAADAPAPVAATFDEPVAAIPGADETEEVVPTPAPVAVAAEPASFLATGESATVADEPAPVTSTDEAAPVAVVPGAGGVEQVAAVPAPVLVTGHEPDDLTKIAGIGPKAAMALAAGGITTYRQLADSDATVLRATLAASGMRASASMASWPERAKQLVDPAS